MNPTILLLVVRILCVAFVSTPIGDKDEILDGPHIVEAVVYADVTSVVEDPGQVAYLTLDVKAVLTGPYDPARFPALKGMIVLKTFIGTAHNRGPEEPPRVKDHVVAMVSCCTYGTQDGSPTPWKIARSQIAFMPDHVVIVPVQGMEDPKVADLIARLRKIRAAQPLGLWEAARRGMAVEVANPPPGEGVPLRTRPEIFNFLYPRAKQTEDRATPP
jgi:hypothetical protein